MISGHLECHISKIILHLLFKSNLTLRNNKTESEPFLGYFGKLLSQNYGNYYLSVDKAA